MQTQLVRYALVVGLAAATMGMGTCATTGGTITTGGTPMPGASMTAAEATPP